MKILPSIKLFDRKRHFIEKNDTIIYSAKAFMNKEVHKVKDLLSNMPGFSVDQTGRVMFNGKEVKYVMINGEDLTGNKYETITKNLQAGLISKVELVKRYHENRLLSGFEWADEQAINLIIDENRKYRINSQASIGISSAVKRKESDANIISLYKKSSTVLFVDANNTGRQSNSFVALKEPEIFMLPNSNSANIFSSDITENYWRKNNDREVNLYHTYKLPGHISLKSNVNAFSQSLSQHQYLSAYYSFPSSDSWTSLSHQYKNIKQNHTHIDLEAKYDNLKSHTSTYQFKIGRSKENQKDLIITTLPFSDTANPTISSRSELLSISGNEYFQIKKKCVVECESMFKIRQLGDNLKIASLKLQFLPDQFSGSTMLLNDAQAHENTIQLGARVLFKIKHRYEQLGWKIDHQYLGTTNQIESLQRQNKIVEIHNYAIYRNNRIQVYWKREESLNKHLNLICQSGLGISRIYWGENSVAKLSGFVSTSLYYRKNSFKQSHLRLTLSRGGPVKNAYFVSPMLTSQLYIMNGATGIQFSPKAFIQYMKTYNDLYKGFSLTYHLTLDQQYNTLVSKLLQNPFYTISGYAVGRRNSLISSTGKIQQNIFPLMIKPFVEIQTAFTGQDQVLNDIQYRIGSRLFLSRLGLVSYWKTKINIEANVEFRHMSLNFYPSKQSSRMVDKRGKAEWKIKYDVAKNIYASMYGLFLWNQQYHNQSTFLDGYMEYKMSENAMMMVRIHNIFNSTVYKERIIAPYMYQETGLDMISRYMMFSIQINL